MAKNTRFNRRALLVGSTALGSTALLAACGGDSSGNASNAESASALGVGEDIAKLISINPKEVSELQQGGDLNLHLGQIGPDFNVSSQNGLTTDNAVLISALSPVTVTGLWESNYEGKKTPNSDFCESFESEVVDGQQILHIKLNPQAHFNDGTPIDIKVLQATTEIYRDGLNNGFNIVDSGPHSHIETLEEEGDAFSVKVTMSQPYYPISDIFGSGLLHPATADAEIFNNGFVDNFHTDWHAGPFKLDHWNSAEKVATLAVNESWWGEKPVLDRIIFRQMESSAARAAFKNGEIDAVSANTLTAYKDVEGTSGAEIRRGQRLFAGGINLASLRLPIELRKAIFAAIDRQAIVNVQFNGLNWTEELPGSVALMPFSTYYKDNFSQAIEGWDSGKILEEAGYVKSGDYYQKDGVNAKFSITTFGDDPVSAAVAQTLVQQMKSAGIECSIDSQPSSNFATIIGNREYDMTFSGYAVGTDATLAVKQYYYSENNKDIGSDEIDAMIDELGSIEDDAERNRLCNDIEQKHMHELAMLGSLYNGPEIYMVKTSLANYGAALFGTPRENPRMWSRIGWVAE